MKSKFHIPGVSFDISVKTDTQKTYYVASPVSTYNTPYYEHMREVARQVVEKLAGAQNTIIMAQGLYASQSEFGRKWVSEVLPMITGGLLFFTDLQGFCGRGVWIEINDVLQKDLPVYLIGVDGTCTPYEKLTIELQEDNFRQYMRVKK